MLAEIAILLDSFNTLAFGICVYIPFELIWKKNYKATLWFIFLIAAILYSADVLKSFFKVPLVFDPGRYGFPSGHTYAFTTLYGWMCFRFSQLAKNYRMKISLVAMYLIVLSIVCTDMIVRGFHTCFDIAGGLGFGVLLLGSVIVFIKYKPNSLEL